MYCKNCGKDIGDAKFCQYCGNSNDSNTSVTVNLIQKDLFVTVKEKIKEIGQEKIIKMVAWISAVINIVIRIVNNEIEVVYNFLAQDDYYVVSASGRMYMLVVIALQIGIFLFLYSDAKKNQIDISKNTIILSVILMVVQIAAMLLRLPAPY